MKSLEFRYLQKNIDTHSFIFQCSISEFSGSSSLNDYTANLSLKSMNTIHSCDDS